jgi:hypothetical protein
VLEHSEYPSVSTGITITSVTIERARAITIVSGEINCLDPGGLGAVTITKTITISCEGVVAGIVASGTNGIVVNAPGGVVILHGLDINGVGTGLAGINIIAASAVQVHKSSIRNFNAGNNNGWGISAAPTAATRIDVTDTVISNNGSASTGGGIRIRPTEAGTVTGAISQVKVLNNAGIGVVVDGSAATGQPMTVAVRDSAVIGNVVTGILSNTGAANALVRVVIDRTTRGRQRDRRGLDWKRRRYDRLFARRGELDRLEIHRSGHAEDVSNEPDPRKHRRQRHVLRYHTARIA